MTLCTDCNQPCYQREVIVSEGKYARQVPFLTHHVDISSEEHGEVFNRVKVFYTKMFALIDMLQAIPSDALKLSYGRLIGLDLGAVMPSACAVRTEVIPLAMVRVAGQVREVQLSARVIDSISVEELVSEIKTQAEPIARQLNANYEARDF